MKEEYFNKITEKRQWLYPTSEELMRNLLHTKSKNGDSYVIDHRNKKVVEQLCHYFSMDYRFEGNPDKGIMLQGKSGTGKTHLMNFFSKNAKASYAIPTCKVIVERYANNWTSNDRSCIEHYSGLIKAEVGHRWDQTHLGICFGDLGAETSEAKNYGNSRNVVEEIVFNRYESNLPFVFTHFTTNLNAEELRTKYGNRFTDRLREMCNVFVMDFESFRK